MTARTPNTFIIGAGAVATALAGALRSGGVPVLGLWARRAEAAREAAAAAGVASYSAAPPDLLLEVDVIILAVRDEAIAEVAKMLLATGLVTSEHVMLHCSGARSAAEIFAGVREHLGGVGTLHPLRAISGGGQGIGELRGLVFGIEGDERGRAAALTLTRALGGTPLLLSEPQMAAYHTAAAMASNFVVVLVDAAKTLLRDVGIPAESAVEALLPLAMGSLENVRRRGIVDGLTGPIKRGDTATVRRHLETLAERAELLDVYRVLGRRAVAIARAAERADAADLQEIDGLLGGTSCERVGERGSDDGENRDDRDG